MRSLGARLVVVWAVSLAACAVLAVLLGQLYAETEGAVRARAELVAVQACERLADRYAFYTSGWNGPADGLDADSRAGLAAVASAAGALAGLTVGFWHDGDGTVASSPTLSAPAPPALADAAAEALATQLPAHRTLTLGGTRALLLACPMRGPIGGLVGWAQVTTIAAGAGRLRLGLGVLLALVLGITAALTWLVVGWNRGIAGVAAALAAPAPQAARSGFVEIDRLADALRAANAKLADAREQAAANERLAALGRVAAGVAHEIRNPVAALRLAAENGLARDPALRGAALVHVLEQATRLDVLTAELLELTQRRPPRREVVALAPFLAEIAGDVPCDVTVAEACLDPAPVRRILSILLDNARRHGGGRGVRVTAHRLGATLRVAVSDHGPGIDAAIAPRLFEPFATGVADGTGLGLAIARELAEAQGGTLRALPAERGALFALDLPWETTCR